MSNKKHQSVELFNPSAYTGYFVRQFKTPCHYTRTHATFPMYNPMSITKKYQPQSTNLRNTIATPWNNPIIYPLISRRSILI